MKWLLLVLCGITVAWAGELPEPPPDDKLSRETQAYLHKINRHHNNWAEVTTNPNGSRQGQRMDVVVYNNASSYKFCVNISSTLGGGTTWRCSANALTAP